MSARTGRVRRAVGRALVDTSPLRRHAGFRQLWTGQLVASLGSQLTVVAVSYQTFRLTGSTAMVGLVSLGAACPAARRVLVRRPIPRGLRRGDLLGNPQFWRYRSQTGPTPRAREAVNEGQVAEG